MICQLWQQASMPWRTSLIDFRAREYAVQQSLYNRLALTAAAVTLCLSLVFGTALAAAGEPVATGSAATLDATLLDGTTFSLAAHRGRVVLVVFWATWCPICRRELPKLEQFYRENAAKGFGIVALSLDGNATVARDYVRKNGFSFAAGWRPAARDNFGRILGTPTTYLIDRRGTILARTEGELDIGDWWAIEDEIAKKP
jgi:thiol-disulfide isomerase/thioredoxin